MYKSVFYIYTYISEFYIFPGMTGPGCGDRVMASRTADGDLY